MIQAAALSHAFYEKKSIYKDKKVDFNPKKSINNLW